MNSRYRKEIERLYLQLYPMLYEYARSSLSSASQAEEAVQETFRIACQKPESLCQSQNPEGWLVNTLKNVLSNTLRSQSIANRILLDYFAATAQDISVSLDQIDFTLLYQDIAHLEEFRLLKEMAVEGKSYLEMAQERNISLATCRKRVERAKKLLRKKMKI